MSINSDMGIAVVLSLAVCWLAWFCVRLWKAKKEHEVRIEVRDRKENVYFVACHPITGEVPDVGEMAEFCFFVKHEEAVEKLIEYEDRLDHSANKFWKNAEVRPTYRLKTISYFFRDGEFINENFIEYGERVEDDIAADRAVRHADLKRMNGDWYKFAQHGQTIEWSKGPGP